jgi:hypothetical protein
MFVSQLLRSVQRLEQTFGKRPLETAFLWLPLDDLERPNRNYLDIGSARMNPVGRKVLPHRRSSRGDQDRSIEPTCGYAQGFRLGHSSCMPMFRDSSVKGR